MSSMRRFVFGGTVIRSELPFETLRPAPVEETPRPHIDLVVRPSLEDVGGPWIAEHSRPGETKTFLRVGRQGRDYVLVHDEGVELWLRADADEIVITRLDPSLPKLHVEHILLDQLLPLVIAHRGRLSLHGSAVAWEHGAVCFLAASGTGKSTLAAALVEHCDAAFLSDDHVVLDEVGDDFVVYPSYPSVRLWDASASALFRAPQRGPIKHRIALPAAGEPATLRAVMLLESAPAEAPTTQIVGLTKRDAMVGIAAQLDRLDPTDRRALRRELDQLTSLVKTTPVRRALVPRDFTRLRDTANAVRAHVEAIAREAR